MVKALFFGQAVISTSASTKITSEMVWGFFTALTEAFSKQVSGMMAL
jgi:hypothetical protein